MRRVPDLRPDEPGHTDSPKRCTVAIRYGQSHAVDDNVSVNKYGAGFIDDIVGDGVDIFGRGGLFRSSG
jgi:hypothetical protein